MLAGGLSAIILRGRKLTVVKYKVETHKIRGRIRLALLTDLHSHSHGEGQETLVNAIKKHNPDLVLMAGDIADHIIPHDNTKTLLWKLSDSDYPCFYASGNHEYKGGEIRLIKRFFRELGVNVLEGECKIAQKGQNSVNICGVDDAVIGAKRFKQQLRRCYWQADKNLFTILLAHRPEKVEIYKQLKFDLILTGHAHGGQVIIPRFINGIYAIHQGLFPKYAGGLYSVGDGKMVVSRGLSKSTRGLPRLFNPPELVIIDVYGV